MKRIALTDGSGRWFNEETARYWSEGSRHDGSNQISKNTGSQWNHEALYRTASGRWVLHTWSQYQGIADTYEEIEPGDAASWLATAGKEPPDEIAQEFADLEL